ncbi:MAG: hypothetical protein P4L82_11925 [Ancalomicrobiaceae bacterium]|nr:hypothetical protein [Ancalomicrobiaceae bacterium]
MPDITDIRSVAEALTPKALSNSLSWTAGGASDAATWTGIAINRAAFSNGALPRSADVFVAYDATLASGKTLSVSYAFKDGADGTNFSDYATQTSTVIATGPSGGGRVVGVARLLNSSGNAPTGTPGVHLGSARNYVRCDIVPDLSATGTDTAVIWAIGEFGGFDSLAAPQS